MVQAILVVAAVLAAAAVAVAAHRRQRQLRRRLEKSSKDLEHLQLAFQRFAPSTVVEEIVGSGRATEADKKEVTVLFADLKGFTTMSESMDPARVVEILNGYFRAMSGAITARRGHITKFMGDGLMALFGTLERNPWQARDAVAAALAMREALSQYNAKLSERGLPELGFGVGVHRGVAVVGVVGSAQLVEYTAIGDTVNVAARVERLTRSTDTDILVTESVREKLSDEFELSPMAPAELKGRREPIRTYAVESGPVS